LILRSFEDAIDGELRRWKAIEREMDSQALSGQRRVTRRGYRAQPIRLPIFGCWTQPALVRDAAERVDR
jgi:hypothetical protein